MGGVQDKLGDIIVRQKSLHGEEAVEEAAGIMAGSRLEQREHRQIALGVGGSEDIEVIAVVKTAPAGVPADIAVRLGVIPVAVAGGNAALFALAQSFFPLLGGGDDGSAVRRKAPAWRGQAPLCPRIHSKIPAETL